MGDGLGEGLVGVGVGDTVAGNDEAQLLEVPLA